jgi:hypothetical protein
VYLHGGRRMNLKQRIINLYKEYYENEDMNSVDLLTEIEYLLGDEE